jgi:molecular chaperone DnaK (HSP70)
MSNLSNEHLIAKYKDAIDGLKAYQAKEPERTKRNAASKLISEYREKIREAAWASLIERTEALEELKKELSGVIKNASDVPTVSGVIADIGGIVSGVSTLLNEG